MRVQVIQPVAHEGPGHIQAWCAVRGHALRVLRQDQTAVDTDYPDDWDVLVVLGGPMGVDDGHAYPWLPALSDYLGGVLHQGRPVLGICLGGQLMAQVLGAEVCRNPLREHGWFPVQGMPVLSGQFVFPPESMVFHWHADTFGLPPGAVHLARSTACAQQAFQWGACAIAVQCHLEMTAASLDGLLQEDTEALLQPGRFVQQEKVIRRQAVACLTPAHAVLDGLLDYLAQSA